MRTYSKFNILSIWKSGRVFRCCHAASSKWCNKNSERDDRHARTNDFASSDTSVAESLDLLLVQPTVHLQPLNSQTQCANADALFVGDSVQLQRISKNWNASRSSEVEVNCCTAREQQRLRQMRNTARIRKPWPNKACRSGNPTTSRAAVLAAQLQKRTWYVSFIVTLETSL